MIGIVLVIGVFGYVGGTTVPEVHRASVRRRHFKYGSIGVEQEEGLPYG